MRKTLEALYYDNLSVSGRTLNRDGEFYKAELEATNASIELENSLSDEQRDLWRKFSDANMKALDLNCKENFILGFRIGVSLLFEGLADTSDDETFPIG